MNPIANCLTNSRAELERAYTSPDRHYHNLDHIQHCLTLFEQMRNQFADAEDVELAIWFHDSVYDSARSDNEDRSADWAAQSLMECGASQEQIDRVRNLILATKHNAAPTEQDARLLVDIDLAILGSGAEQFDAYERAIRREYAHVPEQAFVRGRSQNLEKFLARPHIYLTDHFRDKFEAPARRNVTRSLAQLHRITTFGGEGESV